MIPYLGEGEKKIEKTTDNQTNQNHSILSPFVSGKTWQDAGSNFLGCDDATRSPVVHQWDRHAGALGTFIEQKISCRSDCGYAPPPLNESAFRGARGRR